jgi:hypothetical protein
MSGVVFALALFGCADDGSACQRLAGPEKSYSSRFECMAAESVALESDAAMAADYPSVFAQCMTRSQLAQIGPGTVDLRKRGASFADAAD